MKSASRSAFVILLAMALLVGVIPASAFGLTVTWERNIGTYDPMPPFDDGSLSGPADVAADKWGNVYVTGGWAGDFGSSDDDNRISMFSAEGTFIKKYDNPGVDPTQLSTPRGIAVDRWGHIFVSQQMNSRIEVFNPTLYSHLRTIDSPPDPWGTGIAVRLDGTVFLARQWANVQVRDWFGDVIADPLEPPHPMGVGVSQDGEVYVACDYMLDGDDPADVGQRISVYRPDLSFKYAWGGYGTESGKFARPFDVDVDGANNVFAVEWGNGRAQALSQSGNPLAVIGSPGTDEQQFSNPSGIGVGLDRTVYVADHGNSRISKWIVSTPTTVTNVAGANRYATAVEASKKAYPDGADIVILATGTNWPDALGGSALAGAVHGPLLLTKKDALPGEVATEIVRLAPNRVYVLGSTAAVSDAVMNAAKALTDKNVATRLGGANRYETAIKIAEETKAMLGDRYEGSAFVCTGENFPDALAVSPIAAANGWPIYLTPKDSLRADVRASMLDVSWGGNPSNHGYIIGSTAAVGPAVEIALNTPPFLGYSRHGGINRYDTAAKVADLAFDGMGMVFSRPAIATGQNFPDALAGGVLQGSDYSVMLLTRGDTLSGEAAAMLTKYKDHIYDLRFLGGPTTITTATRNAAKARLW